MSAARGDPKAALGAMYIKLAKPGYTCESLEPDAFDLVRIPPIATPEECTVETSGSQDFVEKVVRGGMDVRLSYLVGGIGANAQYAFELHISNPMSAYFLSSQECVDVARVSTIPMPAQACDVLAVAGANLTQVVYRQYTELVTDMQYNAVVNIEGKAYGSSSSMQALLILTGNLMTLRNWFALDSNGYLVTRPVAEASAAADWADTLPQPWFAALNTLPPVETALLPELFDPEEVYPVLDLDAIEPIIE
jgi:hypothetical protein